jgi:hypothetical protein
VERVAPVMNKDVTKDFQKLRLLITENSSEFITIELPSISFDIASK